MTKNSYEVRRAKGSSPIRYYCEGEGGESAEIEAQTIKEAAVQFAKDIVDTEVDNLPDTITITVTSENDETEDVIVALDREVTFTALDWDA